MIISIKVKANSRDNKISKAADAIVVCIHAPAQEGKANKAIVEFLSESMDIPKSSIEIVSGMTSSHKRIRIADQYQKRAVEFFERL